MNILVTGAAGFVGKNLCEALKAVRDGKDRTRPELKIDEIFEYDIASAPASLDGFCEKADFVHRLYTLCSERGKTRMCILQASVFEKYYYRDFIFDEYRAAKDFAADCVIMRISENVAPVPKRSEIFLKRYKQFAGYLSGENAKLIFTTGFWKNEFADPIVKRAALDCKAELVELGDLGEDSAMRADGLFEHKGVAMHPGDRGMAAIAKRIFSVI